MQKSTQWNLWYVILAVMGHRAQHGPAFWHGRDSGSCGLRRPSIPFLGQLPDGVGASARRFSPQTGREIDCAVRALTEAALRSAREILSQHRALLERGSQELLALETLSEDQVRALLEMPAKPLNTPSAG